MRNVYNGKLPGILFDNWLSPNFDIVKIKLGSNRDRNDKWFFRLIQRGEIRTCFLGLPKPIFYFNLLSSGLF